MRGQQRRPPLARHFAPGRAWHSTPRGRARRCLNGAFIARRLSHWRPFIKTCSLPPGTVQPNIDSHTPPTSTNQFFPLPLTLFPPPTQPYFPVHRLAPAHLHDILHWLEASLRLLHICLSVCLFLCRLSFLYVIFYVFLLLYCAFPTPHLLGLSLILLSFLSMSFCDCGNSWICMPLCLCRGRLMCAYFYVHVSVIFLPITSFTFLPSPMTYSPSDLFIFTCVPWSPKLCESVRRLDCPRSPGGRGRPPSQQHWCGCSLCCPHASASSSSLPRTQGFIQITRFICLPFLQTPLSSGSSL